MTARSYLIAGVATIALTAGSVGAVAATRGASHMNGTRSHMGSAATSCSIPTLPGGSATVMLSDMRGMPMMGGQRSRMMLRATASSVPAGTVSLTAINHGSRIHELVVLPLAAGVPVGARTIGADNRVSESGSLGEASNNCGAGSGEGIQPGSAGWVSLTLRPGRYELLCNLPGHYAAGMYTELDVY